MGYGPIDYSGVDGEAARGLAIATGKVDLYPLSSFRPKAIRDPSRDQLAVDSKSASSATVESR